MLGGSDGASSLRSTEVYDGETKTWTSGPALNVQRANVSAVALFGSLYAIGGFSGKKFLNTLEVLAPDSQEWCCCQPPRRNRKNRIGSADSSGECVGLLLKILAMFSVSQGWIYLGICVCCQIKFFITPCHSLRTLGQPLQTLTLTHHTDYKDLLNW